jgi:hypothetical protein
MLYYVQYATMNKHGNGGIGFVFVAAASLEEAIAKVRAKHENAESATTVRILCAEEKGVFLQ